MEPFILPLTEVLVVADGWRAEPDAEAVIHRAIATAAEFVHAGSGDALDDLADTDRTAVIQYRGT